jgi:hypothetical protein
VTLTIDGVSGRIPNFKRNCGSDDDINSLLSMRKHIVNYVHVIDIYAPCVVKSNIWNRDTNMTQYCGDNLHNFQTYVLSISDEAFLLLVLINYSATWMAEIENEQHKVCCPIMLTCLKLLITTTLTYHNMIALDQSVIAGSKHSRAAGNY